MLLELVTGLLLAAAPETVAQKATPAKPEEKKICRKDIETGSLIKGKKICRTARHWQLMADAARADVERTVGMGSQSGQ